MARSQLNDFVLDSKLGTGSFGTVYKALRKADGKHYALKEIDLRCMTENEQEDCIKECSVLAALNSPYIIKFYDSFLQKGKLYICMEYAAGGNLYDYIRQQSDQLPEERVWQLFIQMLLGLNHMHAQTVLHRDFKTANVFLDEQLNVRLGDLGVAKVLSEQTSNARTLIGTPYYLSPEMCEDKPYNEKSDVWALGVGLYECCARRHPFDAENQGSLILKILRGKYPPVTGYSKELTDIVKSCLTQDASKRPGTNTLLALESVREHAKELDLELPPVPPSKSLSPSPPSRPPIAASRAPSRRVRDAAAASEQPAAGRMLSRSPTPPALGRSPSAATRVPAPVAKVDISAGLLESGLPGAAGKLAGRSRRRMTTDEASDASPAAAPAAGQLQRQLQAMKLAPAAVQARSASNNDIPAVGHLQQPEHQTPPADACLSQSEAACAATSSREVTPPPSDRSHMLQQSLSGVKAQIIELVGPLAFDAVWSMATSMVRAGDSLTVLQNSNGSSGSSTETPGQSKAQSEQQHQQSPLVAAMQRIMPASQVLAVLPLLMKLMYLDGRVGAASSPVGCIQEPCDSSWGCCL